MLSTTKNGTELFRFIQNKNKPERVVIVPDTVKTLNPIAFSNKDATGVKMVYLPDSITEIPARCFQGSTESVDVADEVRKRLIERVKIDLHVYEQVRDGKAVVVNLKDNSRETYAEAMVDCILKTIQESRKPPQHSSPYPD